ncbi:MAG: MlaE family lipid ABC transporter permease subunit [bacterium]
MEKSIERSLLYEPSYTDGSLELRLRGTASMQTDYTIHRELMERVRTSPFQRLVLDVSAVGRIDSSGVALILSLQQVCREKNAAFSLAGAGPRIQGMLRLLDPDRLAAGKPEPVRRSGLTRSMVSLGDHVLLFLSNLRFIMTFFGDVIVSSLEIMRHPRSFRYRDMLSSFETNGVNALPILTLIHFLVGLVLAFQASIQLRQFGATIYVADLVGLAQVREFGPMITAVVLAGRSGSAFAAEIGTMQVNEEIDALRTMGIHPTRFLVLPKTLALLLALPLLTLYADVIGILGGLLVSVLSLDLTIYGYLLETRGAIGVFDVFSGVGKTLAFALIISGVGCLRGFQAGGAAESVGRAATSAVVTGIFLIIVADAVFTVIFQYV